MTLPNLLRKIKDKNDTIQRERWSVGSYVVITDAGLMIHHWSCGSGFWMPDRDDILADDWKVKA